VLVRLVESNLPRLARELPSIASRFLGVAIVNLNSDEPAYSAMNLYLCDPEKDQVESRFVARDVKQSDTRMIRTPPAKFEVKIDGQWHRRQEFSDGSEPGRVLSQRNLRLTSLLSPRHDYLVTAPGASPERRVSAILHAFVYDWIRAEIPIAFSALCREYGVEVDPRPWRTFVWPKS
jgi:hypothetical protein